jgi:hypothetical protein
MHKEANQTTPAAKNMKKAARAKVARKPDPSVQKNPDWADAKGSIRDFF